MIEDLFIRSGSGLDLLDPVCQQNLENWIKDFDIQVLCIDPIGDAWTGDENKKEDVNKLTAYLDLLREKYGISIIIVHHWRKQSKNQTQGAEMASGSYKWNAWLDTHLTLAGSDIKSVTLSCEKQRNIQKFQPLIIGVEDDSLIFRFKKNFEKKFDETTLDHLYEQFDREWVRQPDLIKKAKELGTCSADTVRKLIKEAKTFEIKIVDKAHLIRKKEIQEDFLNEDIKWDQ